MQSRYRVRPGWLGSILLRREGPWSFFWGVGWGLGADVYLCVFRVKGRKVERGRGKEGVDSMQRALLDSTAPLRDSSFKGRGEI